VKTFEASAAIPTDPTTVMELLTDPSACRLWAPVDFELEHLDGQRLLAGSQARVCGRVGGRAVCFDVSVVEAREGRLSISASGPFDVEAFYEAEGDCAGTELRARVSVASRGGVRGRLVSSVAEAFLARGALQHALKRMAETAAATA
jgi:polyketide cyclase/dehydrase/lipid transport protein